jgi:RNA polymerase sigma factor (sigma-70 family)
MGLYGRFINKSIASAGFNKVAASIRLGKGEANIDDETLVQQIRSGQDEYYRILIDRHRSYVNRIVYAVVKHAKDAEEVTQDVWVKIYFALPQYQSQGFKTWISRIAVNQAIDFQRKRYKHQEQLFGEEPPMLLSAVNPLNNPNELLLLRKERKELVQENLAHIPDNYREIIIAFYIEEKSYQQIAVEQGIVIKSVESKLYRAKKWLKAHWKEEDFE